MSMEKIFGNYAPQTYAILRVIVGLLFLCHGLQKVLGLFGGIDGNGAAAPLASLFGVAGLIETVCGLLVAVGFVTGYAAFIGSGQMAVAYFTAHFPRGFWPLQNDGEQAVLFCFIFLYIATRGSGVWSVDGGQRRDGLGF
jgi:putative oxidoreductase